MPRESKRKTNRQSWDEAAMLKALNCVKEGMPYKTASKQFSVPVMSLKRRAKGINIYALGTVKILGSKRPVFTYEQERELVLHIKDMESRMYGLTKQDILSLAYQLAERNQIQHRFSSEKKKAGIDWLKGFRKRHPDITLRVPESTSAARARAFNKPVVDKFFSILKDLQEKYCFPPHRIFNVDETSLCTVPTKNTKVFAETGRKQVARITSAERGDTTTAVICTSASGNFIPPMFIFRRIRMKMELMDGAPPGSVYACNASGWMKLELFAQWFDHFLSHAKPSKDDPALLILDGHLSHTKNLEVVIKARENHVVILCLPPHCTHKLQPLDVGVMYPLSVYHNQALEKWMNNNPGRVVSAYQIIKIFAEAYLKAAVPLNAINGFSKCGIYPFNPDVFTDVDYVAAKTTETELDVQTEKSLAASLNTPPTPHTGTAILPSPSQVPIRIPLSQIPSSSFASSSNISTHLPVDIPSTSFEVIAPNSIHPLPKVAGKRSKLNRKRVYNTILTSTPYKNYLEEETQKKTNKELKKVSRKENRDKKSVSEKRSKGKETEKRKSRRRQNKKSRYQSESSTDEDDTECMFCTETYSKDNMGEGWIRCCVCLRWGHEACAGVDSDDFDDFTCDFCVTDRYENTKRKLDF